MKGQHSKRQLSYSLRWLIYVFNPVVKTKLPAILSQQRSTTVSLETYPFIHLKLEWLTLLTLKFIRNKLII